MTKFPNRGATKEITHDRVGRVYILEDDTSSWSEGRGLLLRYDGDWLVSDGINNGPTALAVDPRTGTAFVARELPIDGYLSPLASVFSGHDLRVIRTIPIGSHLTPISTFATDARGNIVFRGMYMTSTVVLDSENGHRLHDIPGGKLGSECATTVGQDDLLYILNCDGSMTAFAPETYAIVKHARYISDTGKAIRPNSVAVDSSGNVFIAENLSSKLLMYHAGHSRPFYTQAANPTIQEMQADAQGNICVLQTPDFNYHTTVRSEVRVFQHATGKLIYHYQFGKGIDARGMTVYSPGI